MWKDLSKEEMAIDKVLVLYYTLYGWIEMIWLVQCIKEPTMQKRSGNTQSAS